MSMASNIFRKLFILLTWQIFYFSIKTSLWLVVKLILFYPDLFVRSYTKLSSAYFTTVIMTTTLFPQDYIISQPAKFGFSWELCCFKSVLFAAIVSLSKFLLRIASSKSLLNIRRNKKKQSAFRNCATIIELHRVIIEVLALHCCTH